MTTRQPTANAARRSWDLLVLLVALFIGLLVVAAVIGPLPDAAAASLRLVELSLGGAILTMAWSHGRALR